MKYERYERDNMSAAERDLDFVLGEGEEILWQGKPKKKAYILNKVFAMLPIALLWAAFDSVFLFFVFGFDTPPVVRIIVTVFICVHLLPFWIWLSNVLTASKRHSNIGYALTNRRILIRGGLVGVEMQSVSYKDIENVNLRIGLFDRLLKVGDLYFQSPTSRGKTIFFDVEDPYGVYKIAQKIVADIQTDIAFPNAYRPEENAGYQTKYRP